MIELEEATRKLMAKARPLGTEEVSVLEALGRVLREDIRSPFPIPPFSKSAMDGYAVRSADVVAASEESPVELRVLEDVPAGKVGRHRVTKGTAARIMTGAPIPPGADAIVMVEYTERTSGRCTHPARGSEGQARRPGRGGCPEGPAGAPGREP